MKTLAIWLLGFTFVSTAYGQAAIHDFSALYETATPAVVTITTDDGRGSGFLVSKAGHIATNFHVVRNSKYLAVQFPDGRKVAATVVAVNPYFDMAMLKVNSIVVEGIEPLKVLPENEESTVRAGIPVVSIGSPLNQKFLMTQGILSKVEEATLIGDFLIHPGNSGGPLLNIDGKVIGINTFGEANLAGAVRVGILRAFLDSPEMQETESIEPAADVLPSLRAERYPVDLLNRKIEHEPLDWNAYRFEAGDFIVTAVTPVLIGKLHVSEERARATNRYARRSKNISGPSFHGLDEPFYEWHRATESSLDFAITFDIRPSSGLTGRSSFARLFAPLFFLGTAGKLDVEFKGEFLDFFIYRDGQLIEPIMPGRHVIEGQPQGKGSRRFVDQAYSGTYVYSPDEFMTGNEFRIQVIDARTPNQIHKELIFTADSRLIQQIRSDFMYTPDQPMKVP
jgi:hypothetical protein